MSRIAGFRTINLIRSEAHRPALEALGAENVINTETLDLRDEVARVTGGRGVDYAMDCVGGDVAGQMLQCLTLGGHMVVFGTLANTPITLPSRDMMMPATRLSGFFAGSWLALQPPASLPGILGEVGRLASKGVFDTPIDAVYPLTQVHEALAAAQERGRLGKMMLRIGHCRRECAAVELPIFWIDGTTDRCSSPANRRAGITSPVGARLRLLVQPLQRRCIRRTLRRWHRKGGTRMNHLKAHRQAMLLVVAASLLAAPMALADAVTDWNIKAGEIVVEAKLGPPPANRVMAIVQTAVYEAVNAITKRYPAE